MKEFLDSPSYVTWLLGQSVAVVLLVGWVWMLYRMLKKSSATNLDLQTRNEKLSASLVEMLQSGSRERAALQDSYLKTVLDSFEKALQSKRGG